MLIFTNDLYVLQDQIQLIFCEWFTKQEELLDTHDNRAKVVEAIVQI
jgi:hypothetical protein